ncbi:MAG: hypothetical protein RLZZ458_470 [Planctomycetota bacterium]
MLAIFADPDDSAGCIIPATTRGTIAPTLGLPLSFPHVSPRSGLPAGTAANHFVSHQPGAANVSVQLPARFTFEPSRFIRALRLRIALARIRCEMTAASRLAKPMPIKVALFHQTSYHYERPVSLGPQVIRLRPAPHSRTPIDAWSLKVEPAEHFINWQQDPFGNYLARLVFPEKTDRLIVTVDVVADMTVINPFDFFLEDEAVDFPFQYASELEQDLKPFLQPWADDPELLRFRDTVDITPRRTIDFLVGLNQLVQQAISYTIRLEPGVQSPAETLQKRSGSCRDSAWLLVHLLRSFGLAARFVSGYLIQLTADQQPLDGPGGPAADFTDLHAWTEVFLPGAGWVGLDPTSGLLTGEGHIPLAATPAPQSAAPISGCVEPAEVKFDFSMNVSRIHEDPRVTKPYSDAEWERIDQLGAEVDRRLNVGDVRLTMGGEPTFVSIDDMEGAEWNTAAVGPHKQRLSDQLIRRLRQRFAPGALLHYGQGKWYPGESLPRWAYTCLWRTDGQPIWKNPGLLAPLPDSANPHTQSPVSVDEHRAADFVLELARRLEVDDRWIRPAFEDVLHLIDIEQRLPVDVDPRAFDPDSDEDRRRLSRALERGVRRPAGFVLPLSRAWWQADARWTSGFWPFRSHRLFLIPGDSPIGLRLPLESLPAAPADIPSLDPFAERHPLPQYTEIRRTSQERLAAAPRPAATAGGRRQTQVLQRLGLIDDPAESSADFPGGPEFTGPVIRTALCVEPRNGRLHVFMPPVGTLEDYLDLVASVEDTAEQLQLPVILEGYLPPHDPRIRVLKVTPDPGVIEVNIQPASSWEELKQITLGVYEDARHCRLGTEKFQLDGRHTGTGGGNHLVLGAASPADSPFLRRPDLLRSLIAFWNNHPSLSYLFSSLFIGPTSQAPRIDEGRADALSELELAFTQVPVPGSGWIPCWLVDRLFRNLLIDLTGNTHRAEICIDKLYSPDHSAGRLGLVELRGFEMPPHERMSLAQQLLVRALTAAFWEQPYREPLIHWHTAIHDRFLLPHCLWQDLDQVTNYLRSAGFDIETTWFGAHFEFRCPLIGTFSAGGVHVELRQALEPWYVLGEEPGGGGTTRFVDSSVERVQLKVTGLYAPHLCLAVNGVRIPLQATDTPGEFVAGIRYRAWCPPSCLHPTIGVHSPLIIEVIDRVARRSLGGCRAHVDHPGGNNPAGYPINALAAEARRAARFFRFGHSPGNLDPREPVIAPRTPWTLDLRRNPG